MSKFTEAQLRAFDWLPSDGAWRVKPGRLIQSLNSLSLRGGIRMKLIESEWGDFGPRGGRELRWRLTETGVAVKRTLAIAIIEGATSA
jgi:hypothetical protein